MHTGKLLAFQIEVKYNFSSFGLTFSFAYLYKLILHFNSAVHERLLRTSDDFVWPIDITFQGRFIIDVEFLDLKIGTVYMSSSQVYYIRLFCFIIIIFGGLLFKDGFAR